MNTDKTYAEQIASEYAPKKESKVVALKKLDAKAKRPALIFAYTFGTISVLFSFFFGIDRIENRMFFLHFVIELIENRGGSFRMEIGIARKNL